MQWQQDQKNKIKTSLDNALRNAIQGCGQGGDWRNGNKGREDIGIIKK
jgi:hypothetical protein